MREAPREPSGKGSVHRPVGATGGRERGVAEVERVSCKGGTGWRSNSHDSLVTMEASLLSAAARRHSLQYIQPNKIFIGKGSFSDMVL